MFHLLVVKVVQTQQKNKAELSLQASKPFVSVHTDQPSFSALDEAQALKQFKCRLSWKGGPSRQTQEPGRLEKYKNLFMTKLIQLHFSTGFGIHG